MQQKLYTLLAVFLILTLGVSAVQADETDVETELELEEDYPWRNHAEPMEFKFGNMIDSHQQSHLDSNGVLHGFIYIHFTGDFTEEGIPIARKANCLIESCSVGWVIKGVPYEATLKNKGPRVWLINPAGLPMEPGYTHFQWTGCPKKPHGLIVDREDPYQGYLLKRVAVTTFYWLGGDGGMGGGGAEGSCSDGGEEGGCSGHEGEEDGCSGGGGDMGGGGSEGSCSDGGEESGCSGHEGEEDACSGGGGSEGNCSDGGEESGCSGHEGEEGGCSGGGGDMGGGSSGHGGRLVTEGIDSHSNIVTPSEWDGTWQGGGCDD